MIELKTKLRKWGNSLGVVVPFSKISKEDVEEGQEVTIFISKQKPDVKRIFGKLRKWKIDSQKVKDKLREEEKL